MASMTQADLESFLNEPHIGHLITLRPDGSPHAAPIWYEYRDGQFLVWTSRDTRKFKNIAGDARIALSIASEDEPYKYMSIEGKATVSNTDVRSAAVSIAVWYLGRERGAAFAKEYFEEGVSVLLTITPTRLTAWTDEG